MGWFYFFIYLIVFLIGLCILNRYNEDHCYFDVPEDIGDMSSYECWLMAIVLWPITIPIIIIVSILFGVYKIFYYVVDKIYTLVIHDSRKKKGTKKNNR